MFEFYKDKKVFITGNTGFKGSYLCEMLLAMNANILGYSSTKEKLYGLLELDKRMTTVIGDIRDYKLLSETIKNFKPDIIIHMAAQPIVRESYLNPKETYEINIMGTVNILEITRSLDCVKSFINVTTDKVYLNKEWDYGYRENDELCGFDPYSNSKSCSELITYSYKNSFPNNNISISTVRSGNVIGGGDFAKDRIIPDCMRAYLNKENIIIRNPSSVRPFQHVLDTLYGYLLLGYLQYDNKSYEGSYNFGPNESDCLTTGDLAALFCNSVNNEISWVNKSDNGPHETKFLRLDTSKTRLILKWSQLWNIEESIKKIVEWVIAYKNNENMEKITQSQIKEYLKKRKKRKY